MLNILLIGMPLDKLVSKIIQSEFLGKIYVTEKSADFPNIEYASLEELAYKARKLNIDIAINLDKTLIFLDIVDVFKKSGIMLFSVNKKWLNLEDDRLATKKLLEHYSINIPKTIKAPVSFPLVLKTKNNAATEFISSMDELIKKAAYYTHQKIYLEEYLNGEIFDLLSLWDGKNIIFQQNFTEITEVQNDRLELFKTKLHIMFSDENAGFIGFFITRLIWSNNDWYVKEFVMCPDKTFNFNIIQSDVLYLLNATIYQKLHEIKML